MPCIVISDGKFVRDYYSECGMSDEAVKKFLRSKKLDMKDVLIMTVDREGNTVVVEKEKNV